MEAWIGFIFAASDVVPSASPTEAEILVVFQLLSSTLKSIEKEASVLTPAVPQDNLMEPV